MEDLDVSSMLPQDMPCPVEKRGCFAPCDFGADINVGLRPPEPGAIWCKYNTGPMQALMTVNKETVCSRGRSFKTRPP